MQIPQLVALTQQSNTATSANDTNANSLSRKERREQADVRQQWQHKKMVAAVSATIAPEVPQKKGLIKLHSGQDFVLIFECVREDIPNGVKIRRLYAGSNEKQQDRAENADTRLSAAKVDLIGLTERVSVKSVNVTNRAGYLVAYVNCTVGKTDDVGFKYKGCGTDEAFVRRVMAQTWNRAIIKNESDDRTTLTLRKAVEKQYETKIRFAIE